MRYGSLCAARGVHESAGHALPGAETVLVRIAEIALALGAATRQQGSRRKPSRTTLHNMQKPCESKSSCQTLENITNIRCTIEIVSTEGCK